MMVMRRPIHQISETMLLQCVDKDLEIGRRHEADADKLIVGAKGAVGHNALEGVPIITERRKQPIAADHDRNGFGEYGHITAPRRPSSPRRRGD
jgi:hypothetical protein